jgi:hypothetical protein
MTGKTAVRIWSNLGIVATLGITTTIFSGCSHSGAPVQQQPTSAMAPEASTTSDNPSLASVREIHVNQDCIILQDRLDGIQGITVPGSQPIQGGERDSAVCHLESQFTSNHVKGTVVNGAVQRSVVVIKEQEYLLQNEFQTPVVFLVEQLVPDGWKIDSDPAPTSMAGKIALFKVSAQPGQIVRLHVGEAHEIPLASPNGM